MQSNHFHQKYIINSFLISSPSFAARLQQWSRPLSRSSSLGSRSGRCPCPCRARSHFCPPTVRQFVCGSLQTRESGERSRQIGGGHGLGRDPGERAGDVERWCISSHCWTRWVCKRRGRQRRRERGKRGKRMVVKKEEGKEDRGDGIGWEGTLVDLPAGQLL